jgi:hypothetical protein
MFLSSSIAIAPAMLRMGFRILWLVPEQPLDDHHLSMKIISAVDSGPVQTLRQHLIDLQTDNRPSLSM